MVAQLPSLLHVASCHKIGLTNQEVERAIAFQNIGKFKFMVVCGEKEQVPGLKEQLAINHIPFNVILGLDDHLKPLRLIKECVQLIKNFSPDIIALTTNWHLCIFSIAKLFVKKKPKLVYTIHGFRNQSKLKSTVFRVTLIALLFLFASLVIAPTSWVGKKFILLKSKLVVIPLGVSTIFIGKYIKPDFSKPIIFLFVSNFRDGKNHQFLIATFAKYLRNNSQSSVNLYLPGSGNYLNKMKSYVSQLHLENRIFFPGELSAIELHNLYLESQFAIIPSLSETFGFCIAEPFIMGRIVISNKVGVALDIITPGENGFLFDNQDHLYKLMDQVLSMSEEDLLVISKTAYDSSQSLNWTEVVNIQSEKLIQLLK